MQSNELASTDTVATCNQEIHIVSSNLTESSVSMEQAYRFKYKETLVPHSGPTSHVIRPTANCLPESKRANQIEHAEDDLEADMEEVKTAVHAYNVEFQKRIDTVKLRGRDLEVKLEIEDDALMTSMDQLRGKIQKQFESAFVVLEQKTLSYFARVETHEIVSQEKKLQDCRSEFHSFAYTTVPNIVEKLQGTVTSNLEKKCETFDIENAKNQMREKKTLRTLECNERKSEANIRAEYARRVAKFQEREEELHHVMRVDNRCIERLQSIKIQGLLDLYSRLQAESTTREKEDSTILDNLSSSFGRLQISIFEHLGDHDDQLRTFNCSQ
ncbi:uncharacterized protein PHALS_11829 [Plasmopara halstedii]|uniref:Uncharacterized protein n=1 Tax=Plasmopara halstedii TaxID=4781 RepID=A0A0P1AJR6_PLAHL|nr:uncharacterized protein PHALS_11829 [Plasmopara halstedii]CEG41488.1 hypothetical protein PHALS_11829 [Plasmopara halstedii]|eukprot:XP_024577857.1 hypothetical protein PHALS_11829 [Plasmopara halstedii]